MTCIVGFESNGNVYIGGDSAATDGNLGIRVRADGKVFSKDNMIFGIAGSVRLAQLLRYSFVPPNQSVGQDDFGYLCSSWIGGLLKCLQDNGCSKIVDNEAVMPGEFLLGFGGNLYHIYSDFQVADNSLPYDACGCASDYALGVMAAVSEDDKTPEEKITKALEVAEEFSAGVMGPFVIKKLDSEQVDIVPALVEILSKENND